jgi:hypothetical protein
MAVPLLFNTGTPHLDRAAYRRPHGEGISESKEQFEWEQQRLPLSSVRTAIRVGIFMALS